MERAGFLDRAEWPAKFRDSLVLENAQSVNRANQCVESGRISHGLLQMLKPLLGIGESLGVKVGNARK